MPPADTQSGKEKSKRQQLRWFLTMAAIGLGFVAISFAVSYWVMRSTVLDDLGFLEPLPVKGTDTLSQIRGDIWQKLLGGTALLIGAGWALTHFVLKRTNEAALKIDMTGGRPIVDKGRVIFTADVVLENIGGVRIAARRKQFDNEHLLPAYVHPGNERLEYSVSMLIRPLPKAKQSGTLDWFDFDGRLKPSDLIAEINLIDSYEVEDKKVNFWMEPSEVYHLPVIQELEPGNYLAMVTFVGDRGEFEFWRRFFVFDVDPPRPKSLLQELGGIVSRLKGR
jgi:hypothetical protein